MPTKSQEIAADISALLRARNPLLWVVTREEARAEQYLIEAAAAAGYVPRTWDVAQGVVDIAGNRQPIGGQDPGETLNAIDARATRGAFDRGVWILRDLLARWETERTIADPAEFEAATKLRSKVRSVIGSVCANSAFGLICPEQAADDLDKAIAEARNLTETFNAAAKLTRLRIYIIAGRIAPDDVEAVRAINSEVRDLLAAMAAGVANLDVKVVRDAASRARDIGRMLAPDAQTRIQIAIDAARAAARRIVKAGEQAALEIDQATIRRITEARTAFLDLDELVTEIAAPAAEARAVDFEPVPEVKTTPAPRAALEFE